MTPVSLRMTVFRWFALALAVLALNVSLSFTNIWPTLGIRASSAVSLELAAVVLGLLIARRVGRIGSSGLRWLVHRVGGLGARAVYRRHESFALWARRQSLLGPFATCAT